MQIFKHGVIWLIGMAITSGLGILLLIRAFVLMPQDNAILGEEMHNISESIRTSSYPIVSYLWSPPFSVDVADPIAFYGSFLFDFRAQILMLLLVGVGTFTRMNLIAYEDYREIEARRRKARRAGQPIPAPQPEAVAESPGFAWDRFFMKTTVGWFIINLVLALLKKLLGLG